MSIYVFKKSTNYVCNKCNISEWLGQKITLEIDHINGDNKDNDISNLRYLCPNCHSQTETWRGRNRNSGLNIVSDEDLINAVKNNKNIRQALISVGLTPKGGNYARVSELFVKNDKDINNSQYGTVWINDGKNNKKIKIDLLEDYLSCGFKKGRLADSYKPNSQKGKIWVTNGLLNKMVLPESIPEGFWKGKFQKK